MWDSLEHLGNYAENELLVDIDDEDIEASLLLYFSDDDDDGPIGDRGDTLDQPQNISQTHHPFISGKCLCTVLSLWPNSHQVNHVTLIEHSYHHISLHHPIMGQMPVTALRTGCPIILKSSLK